MSSEHVCVVDGVRYVFFDRDVRGRKSSPTAALTISGGQSFTANANVDFTWRLVERLRTDAGRQALSGRSKAEPVEP
jgi:hypothetical protein